MSQTTVTHVAERYYNRYYNRLDFDDKSYPNLPDDDDALYPYVGTPEEVVNRGLEFCEIKFQIPEEKGYIFNKIMELPLGGSLVIEDVQWI